MFVRLGSYLQPENDRPPRKGVHLFHVLVLFPVEQQPWKSLAGWMRTAANPFPKGSWIACSGRLLGILDPILVVLPDSWELIRQNTLSQHNTPAPTSPGPVTGSPTTPRPAVSGRVASRNPFSSPNCATNLSPRKSATVSTFAPETSDREPTGLTVDPGAPSDSITVDLDPVLSVPTAGMSHPAWVHDAANCNFR